MSLYYSVGIKGYQLDDLVKEREGVEEARYLDCKIQFGLSMFDADINDMYESWFILWYRVAHDTLSSTQ